MFCAAQKERVVALLAPLRLLWSALRLALDSCCDSLHAQCNSARDDRHALCYTKGSELDHPQVMEVIGAGVEDGLVSGPQPDFFVTFRALSARYAGQPVDLLSVLNLAFLHRIPHMRVLMLECNPSDEVCVDWHIRASDQSSTSALFFHWW